MTYSNVVILTEGGGAKGLGHVYRSIEVAKQLPGARVNLPLHRRHSDALMLIEDAGIRYTEALTADVVIRDVIEHEELTRGKKLTIDICDDVGGLERLTSATVRKFTRAESTPRAFGFMNSDVRCFSGGWIGCYWGLEYAILRAEFASFTPPHSRDEVVVCLGGVDPSNASMKLAAGLYGIDSIRASVLTGPGSKWGGGDQPVWEALGGACMAVVSPGSTLLECAAMGVPALVVSHNTREHERVLALQKQRAQWFHYLGRAADVTPAQVESSARRLLDSPQTMETMSLAGRRAVDGCGAWRVGGIIRRAIAQLDSSDRPAATSDESVTK